MHTIQPTTTLLDIAVPVYSLRGLQQVDFGMVGAYLDSITRGDITAALLIFASKYPTDTNPEEPIYVPLVSVYDVATDTLNYTRLPESVDSMPIPVATPDSSNTHIKVPGIPGVFRKDVLTTKRFNHRHNMFRRSTKGILNFQNKHFTSMYSRTDLENLRSMDALPSWATHVYTPDSQDARIGSPYDRIYRLATYRFVGETQETGENKLVYFQQEPVPSFYTANAQAAEILKTRSAKVMTIVPQDSKIIWTLDSFFNPLSCL